MTIKDIASKKYGTENRRAVLTKKCIEMLLQSEGINFACSAVSQVTSNRKEGCVSEIKMDSIGVRCQKGHSIYCIQMEVSSY